MRYSRVRWVIITVAAVGVGVVFVSPEADAQSCLYCDTCNTGPFQRYCAAQPPDGWMTCWDTGCEDPENFCWDGGIACTGLAESEEKAMIAQMHAPSELMEVNGYGGVVAFAGVVAPSAVPAGESSDAWYALLSSFCSASSSSALLADGTETGTDGRVHVGWRGVSP